MKPKTALSAAAIPALLLSVLAGSFAVVSAETAASNEKKIMSVVKMMIRSSPADSITLSEDSKAGIRSLIEDAKAGIIKLDCIDAFNDYNFCLLANKILGNLYKSHGCLHVSPINARVLNEVLPVGSVVEIKPYDADFDTEKAKDIPSLISLIDYKSDLKDIKSDLSSKTNVKTVVYPAQDAYVILLDDEPYAALRVTAGPKEKMYMLQSRNEKGYPVFDSSLAAPTPAGKLYVFKKVVNYVSNTYKTETTIPMGAAIKKINEKWMFEISENIWKPAPEGVSQDIGLSGKDRQYVYFDILKDAQGNITQARWASNTFGTYPILLSRDKKHQAPELIHTTCDLMLDQYSMLSDMFEILSKPYDSFEKCLAAATGINDIKGYYDFDQKPSSGGIDTAQAAYYKLYFDLPLLTAEESSLPSDAVIANKIIKNLGPLNEDEKALLIKEGLAVKKGGNTVIDMKKIYGLQFYTYQNVVMIKKYSDFYSALRDNWDDLSALRSIIIEDMRKLSIIDPALYRRFAVELMVKRIGLQQLTQDDVLDELSDTLGL